MFTRKRLIIGIGILFAILFFTLMQLSETYPLARYIGAGILSTEIITASVLFAIEKRKERRNK